MGGRWCLFYTYEDRWDLEFNRGGITPGWNPTTTLSRWTSDSDCFRDAAGPSDRYQSEDNRLSRTGTDAVLVKPFVREDLSITSCRLSRSTALIELTTQSLPTRPTPPVASHHCRRRRSGIGCVARLPMSRHDRDLIAFTRLCLVWRLVFDVNGQRG